MKRIPAIFLLCTFFLVISTMLFAAEQPCQQGRSGGVYSCNDVALLSHIPLGRFSTKPTSASNLWGYVDPDDNREYAILGLSNGTAVVEVTNPIKPRIVGVVPAVESQWREVKAMSVYNQKTGKYDGYVYVVTESVQGLQIIDLSKLPKSVSLIRIDHEIKTAHTLFISNVDFATGIVKPGLTPYLYLNGANRGDFRAAHEGPGRGLTVFDLKNPKNPQIVGEYSDTYVHDIYAQTFDDSRASQCAPGHNPCEVVFAWTGEDFRIIDYTDKKHPVVLGTLAYDGVGYAHSGWISRNGQFLFNFDELDESNSNANTRILTIRISDFRNPQVKGTWTGETQAIEHNGYVVGNRLYVSHYTLGLVVFDTTNPTRIRQVGFFDTFPAHDQNGFFGAWGAYPYLPSGIVLISDIQGGLFVLREVQ